MHLTCPSNPHSKQWWPQCHPSHGAPASPRRPRGRPLAQHTNSGAGLRQLLTSNPGWHQPGPEQLHLSPESRGASQLKDRPSPQTGKDLSLPARSPPPASSALGGALTVGTAATHTHEHMGLPATPAWGLAWGGGGGSMSFQISVSTSHVPCGGRS